MFEKTCIPVLLLKYYITTLVDRAIESGTKSQMESSQPNCQHTPAAGTPAPAVEVLADAWDPDLKSRLLCKELAPALRFPREFACHSL